MNKNQVIEAGLKMRAVATPAQQANHDKVLEYIKTLPESEIPDLGSSLTQTAPEMSYRGLCASFVRMSKAQSN